MRDSKAGAGIQDERSECLSARRGREYFVFYKRSEIKNLVTRDRIPMLCLRNKINPDVIRIYFKVYFEDEGFESRRQRKVWKTFLPAEAGEKANAWSFRKTLSVL